ncbi:MAG: hypothetical protein HQL25_06400 [Candidatus Omnitrophica bacterium]|nr:hypothetical protein [Candidatus Omnitrophota bacterium]
MLKKLFIFTVALLFFPYLANAQIMIEQGKIVLNAEPNSTASGEIVIHNTTNKEISIKSYFEDFAYKPPFDGAKDFMPQGVSPNSVGAWVSTSPTTFKLSPRSQQIVTYTVKVPEVFNEGHYGVLFFENAPESASMGGKSINLVSRTGSLFFVEPVTKSKTTVITDIKVKDNKIVMNFENKGNVIVVCHPVYNLITSDGNVVDRGDLENIYLPPSTVKDLTFDPKIKDDGTYTLMLSFDLQDEDVINKEITLTKNGSLISIDKISD